jgi:hypothetical protein
MKISVVMAALCASTALAVTACGGSSPAASSPGPAQSGSGSGAAGSASSAGTLPVSSQAKNINLCTVLPVGTASKITGTTFTSAKSSSVEGQVFGCEYRGRGAALLQISVDTKFGKNEFSTDLSILKQVGHAPNRVSGVGDEAYSAADPHGNAGSIGASAFASYGAVFGDAYIKIGGLTYVTAAQGKQLVELIHHKL